MSDPNKNVDANTRQLSRPYRRSVSSLVFREDNLLKEKPRACPSAAGVFSRQEKSDSSAALNMRRPASSVSFRTTSAGRFTQSRPSVISLSEQGLQATRPPSSGSRVKGRLIQDKAYYVDLLREKIRSFKMEINRLTGDKAKFINEYENQAPLNETATLLAEQIHELRRALANYNFLLDKQNTRTSLADVLQECASMERSNSESAQEIDKMYEESRTKEKQIADAEETLQLLKRHSDTTLINMDEDAKVRYYALLQRKVELENRLEGQSAECQNLNEKIDKLECELGLDGTKIDALKLISDLAQMNNERARLRAEVEEHSLPQQKREKLLSDMKQDNKDILSMQKQMEELRQEITLLKAEKREFIEMDSNASVSNRQKPEKEAHRLSRLCASEKAAIAKLKLCINNLEDALLSGAARSGFDGESDKDKLLNEYLQVVTVLEKRQNTASVYNEEINRIEEKIGFLKEDLRQYNMLDDVHENAERRSLESVKKKAHLKEQIDKSVQLFNELEARHSSVDQRINENKQMQKIIGVERSLHSFKKENACLQAELKSYAIADNVQVTKEAVLKSVADYNNLLVHKHGLLPHN